jgi:hypothetical protein
MTKGRRSKGRKNDNKNTFAVHWHTTPPTSLILNTHHSQQQNLTPKVKRFCSLTPTTLIHSISSIAHWPSH